MNTGNGKTLVGVMLLTSSLNEHAGPAAYLTPDRVYLVDQVEAAADLGLSTSRDPRGTGQRPSGARMGVQPRPRRRAGATSGEESWITVRCTAGAGAGTSRRGSFSGRTVRASDHHGTGGGTSAPTCRPRPGPGGGCGAAGSRPGRQLSRRWSVRPWRPRWPRTRGCPVPGGIPLARLTAGDVQSMFTATARDGSALGRPGQRVDAAPHPHQVAERWLAAQPQRQPGRVVDVTARIERRQVLGGLISEYRRAA